MVDVASAASRRGQSRRTTRVLGAEGARAPEPVGVPAPEVVVASSAGRSRAAGASGSRSAGRCSRSVGAAAVVGPAGQGQVVARPARTRRRRGRRRARRRHSPVSTIAATRLGEQRGVVEADVPQRDVRRAPARARSAAGWRSRASRRSWGRCRTGPSPGRVRDDLAGAGEDVHLEHRLVRQPVAEAGRLDAEPGHRAAERDRAQLRHDERDQAVRQRRVDEVLVGAHALHVGGPRRRRRPRSRRRGRTRRARASVVAARGRNRLEVRLASRTGAPAGMAAYDARSRATAARACSRPTAARTHATLAYPGRARASRSHGQRLRWRVERGDRAAGVADVHRHAGAGEVAQRRRGRRGTSPSSVSTHRRLEAAGARRRPPSRRRPRARRPAATAGRRWRRRRCGRRGRGRRRPRRRRCGPGWPGRG